MRTNLKTLLSAAAVVAALAAGPAVYAYADTPSQEGSGGMMAQGGMMDMMNMMGQMTQMMETCNNMMHGMAQHHGPETPKGGKNPEQEG